MAWKDNAVPFHCAESAPVHDAAALRETPDDLITACPLLWNMPSSARHMNLVTPTEWLVKTSG